MWASEGGCLDVVKELLRAQAGVDMQDEVCCLCLHMSMFANNALLGGGVRVRVWIREQRKIKRRSKSLLSL